MAASPPSNTVSEGHDDPALLAARRKAETYTIGLYMGRGVHADEITVSDASRLFLALWPDDSVRRQLTAWRDSWHWPHAAVPVHDERLHLTLHFLGDVERARLPALRVSVTPFELSFGSNALWPHGIAVLEPLAIPPALAQLQGALGQLLTDAGLPLDTRPYRPHVTMARRAVQAALPAAGPSFTWTVDSYALVESSGGRYTVLEHMR